MAKVKLSTIYFDRKDLQFKGLTDLVMNQLKSVYFGVDVEAELEKMKLWLLSTKGSRRKGDISFITGWIKRAHKALPPENPLPKFEHGAEDTPLRPHIDAYLKELWKGREHILEINKVIKKR